MNLLKETELCILDSGHAWEDVIFIGSEESGHKCSVAEFKKLADIEYDAGYGGQEIAEDLIIVFSDNTLLLREEYDGSENWTYLCKFKMPKEVKTIKELSSHGKHCGTLEDLN